MKVHELKKSIETILEQNANGRYVVLNPRNRSSDAENILKTPCVTVLYSEGSFDKHKSSVNNPYHHDCTFNIFIEAAAKSTANLAVLQNPAATAEQCTAALAASGNASIAVDEKIDESVSLLFNVIMHPKNRELGTDYITGRWITKIKKYNPEPAGAIVTAVASITLVAQCEEEIIYKIGESSAGIVETALDHSSITSED